jgi:hypothetical protein
VPNCEIFYLLGFRDFDAANIIWEGDLATGIFRHFFMLGADRAGISSPKLYSCKILFTAYLGMVDRQYISGLSSGPETPPPAFEVFLE